MLAARRAALTGQFLKSDLDGDGALSAAEIARSTGTDRARLLAARYAHDSDGDAALARDEIAEAITAEMDRFAGNTVPRTRLMQFDFNDDGAVTAAEIIATIDALNRSTIPGAKSPRQLHLEDKAARAREAQKRREAERKAKTEALRLSIAGAGLPELCAYPELSPEAQLYWLSAERGEGASTVAISGTEIETTVATLHIEPGGAPIYLVAGSYASVIWEVTGNVGRIEQFVTHPDNAVTGLTAEKVHFAKSGVCAPGPSDLGKSKAQQVFESTLAVAFEGQNIQRKMSSRQGAVLFPSMRTIIERQQLDRPREPAYRNGEIYGMVDGEMRLLDPAEAARQKLVYDAAEKFPRGVIEIDLEAVVSERPATPYELLPAEIGLLQMMEQGSLRGEGFDRLIITEPVSALPSGLRTMTNRRIGQKFFVEPGVRLDIGSGNLAGFTFFDAQTGGCVEGVPCGIQRSPD